jgi:hypothetical protein
MSFTPKELVLVEDGKIIAALETVFTRTNRLFLTTTREAILWLWRASNS